MGERRERNGNVAGTKGEGQRGGGLAFSCFQNLFACVVCLFVSSGFLLPSSINSRADAFTEELLRKQI